MLHQMLIDGMGKADVLFVVHIKQQHSPYVNRSARRQLFPRVSKIYVQHLIETLQGEGELIKPHLCQYLQVFSLVRHATLGVLEQLRQPLDLRL